MWVRRWVGEGRRLLKTEHLPSVTPRIDGKPKWKTQDITTWNFQVLRPLLFSLMFLTLFEWFLEKIVVIMEKKAWGNLSAIHWTNMSSIKDWWFIFLCTVSLCSAVKNWILFRNKNYNGLLLDPKMLRCRNALWFNDHKVAKNQFCPSCYLRPSFRR